MSGSTGLSILAIVAVLVAPTSASGTEERACRSFPLAGREVSSEDAVSVAEVLTRVSALDGRYVTVRGILMGESLDHGSGRYLCSERTQLVEECLDLRFEIDVFNSTYDDVLRQWNGEQVLLRGVVEHWPFISSVSKQFQWFLTVNNMTLAERSASPAFCHGYAGPLEPSPVEDRYDGEGHATRLSVFYSTLEDGKTVDLHYYKAIALVSSAEGALTNVVPFSVPPPFSGRDIKRFVAVGEDKFAYTLRSGPLYLWDAGILKKLHDGPVELLPDHDGNALYLTGPRRELGREYWSSLNRIPSEGKTETVWASDGFEIQHVDLDDGVVLQVRAIPEVRVLTFPSANTSAAAEPD